MTTPDAMMPAEWREVTIPACKTHEGFDWNKMTVRLRWVCPVCGGPRGEPFETRSYDGSRWFKVDGWRNPCGHVDSYADCRKEAERARLDAEADAELNDPARIAETMKRVMSDSAIVQAMAESWAARQAASTDDMDTYTWEEVVFNGALKRLGIEATREEVRELNAAMFVAQDVPGDGTFMSLSYADHDDRGCTLSVRYENSPTSLMLDVPLAISNAQGKALLAKAQRDAKPPLPEVSADSLFDNDDTQPGVPVDLGAFTIKPAAQVEFAEQLLRIKKLKAELESLGCTVKVTMTGDGAAIKAANWLLSRSPIEQG